MSRTDDVGLAEAEFTYFPLPNAEVISYRQDPHAGPEQEISLHHRNEAAKTGRFTSEDPAEDDRNLYRPVGNNPVDHEDPGGLEETGHHWLTSRFPCSHHSYY